MARTLKWNDLPRTTRDRLLQAMAKPPSIKSSVDPDQPILANKVGTGGRIVGWAILGGCALFVMGVVYKTSLGQLYYAARSYQTPGYALFYALMWFTIVFSVLAGLYRHLMGKNLPYSEGTYLFGLDVVVADAETLTITPLSQLTKIRVTDHHRNGAYQYTSYAMDFPNNQTVLFTMAKDHPEQIQARLQEARKRLGQAVENKDLAELKKADLLFDIRSESWKPQPPEINLLGDGPVTKPVEPWLHRRLQIAAGAGFLLGLITWQARDVHHDRKRLTQAIELNTADALEHYLNSGKRHRTEAETRLYPLLYAEVKASGKVSGYREMLRKYPKTPLAAQARADIHQLIQSSWEKFKARAGNSDPKMLDFMQRVVAYLEEKEDATVRVYFSPPLIRSLVAIDAELRKKGVAPVAPHFSAEASKPREQYIVSALEKGFGEVFPSDILHLVRPIGPMTKAATAPTIEIKYLVTPTDAVYQGKQTGRSFVGIRVSFLMTMRVPGESQGFPMMLSVLPPQRFTVSFSSRRRYGTAALPGEGPSDLAVYTAMAERAFDQFHDKLAQVLFGAAPVVDPSDAPAAPAPATAGAAAEDPPMDKPDKADAADAAEPKTTKPSRRKRHH